VSELSFEIIDVAPEPHAAAPMLRARLQVTESTGETVHAVVLQAQVRIEPQRRRYGRPERDALAELFGEPNRWGDTLHPFPWTSAVTRVPRFRHRIDVDLQLPCSYDFDVTASRYLHGLTDGEIPLLVLFAGSVFTRGLGGFAVSQIPWHSEARYRLPVTVWRDLMERYFPNSGWLRLDRATLTRLQRYRSTRALPSWEATFSALLKEAGDEER
jgi:hypothetical protein